MGWSCFLEREKNYICVVKLNCNEIFLRVKKKLKIKCHEHIKSFNWREIYFNIHLNE